MQLLYCRRRGRAGQEEHSAQDGGGGEGPGVCRNADLFCSQESLFIPSASASEPPGGKTMGSGVG